MAENFIISRILFVIEALGWTRSHVRAVLLDLFRQDLLAPRFAQRTS